MKVEVLHGKRFVLEQGSEQFPEALKQIPEPPKRLYVIGEPSALRPGLAVIGARKSTPYGRSCARHFARLAADKGIVIISGGARGCDSEAHRAALDAGAVTVAFLGGGCDQVYPAEHRGLFQQIIDAGGAVVSEHGWGFPPRPYTFRARNRLIAGLAHAVLIVEAGLPSGTFSTADEAIEASREVWAVPGSIASPHSRGSNRLILQGALPIVDDEVFDDALSRVFATLRWSLDAQGDGRVGSAESRTNGVCDNALVDAICAQPLSMDELYALAEQIFEGDSRTQLVIALAEAEAAGLIARQSDGRWGPRVCR